MRSIVDGPTCPAHRIVWVSPMRVGGTDEHQLELYVRGLEAGYYELVLPGRTTDGPSPIRPRYPAIVLLARAQAARAVGDLQAVRDSLTQAVRWLPRRLVGHDADKELRAVLPGGCVADGLSARLAALVWREQRELDDLRLRAQETSVHGALTEAMVEVLVHADFDPFYLLAVKGDETGSSDLDVRIDRSRGGLCRRAAHLRQLARPQAGSVSPSAYSDAGGHDGLRGAALEVLADRPAVPWLGEPGTEALPVRLGRIRAKEFADRRREVRSSWA